VLSAKLVSGELEESNGSLRPMFTPIHWRYGEVGVHWRGYTARAVPVRIKAIAPTNESNSTSYRGTDAFDLHL